MNLIMLLHISSAIVEKFSGKKKQVTNCTKYAGSLKATGANPCNTGSSEWGACGSTWRSGR